MKKLRNFHLTVALLGAGCLLSGTYGCGSDDKASSSGDASVGGAGGSPTAGKGGTSAVGDAGVVKGDGSVATGDGGVVPGGPDAGGTSGTPAGDAAAGAGGLSDAGGTGGSPNPTDAAGGSGGSPGTTDAAAGGGGTGGVPGRPPACPTPVIGQSCDQAQETICLTGAEGQEQACVCQLGAWRCLFRGGDGGIRFPPPPVVRFDGGVFTIPTCPANANGQTCTDPYCRISGAGVAPEGACICDQDQKWYCPAAP